MTLTEFLTVRLDEDEAAANAYVPVAGLTHRHSEGNGWLEHNHLAGGDPHQHDPDTGFQIPAPTVGDPARVLREVEAGRKILAEHEAVTRLADLTEQELGFLGLYREWVLKNLAAVYSDHPDYDPAWASGTPRQD